LIYHKAKILWGLGIYLILSVAVSGLNFYYETIRPNTLISIKDIEFNNTQMYHPTNDDSYGVIKITSNIKNNSKYTLDSLTLMVLAYDCPSIIMSPNCEIIGQNEVHEYITVPPGQIREMESLVFFSDIPLIKNNFKWTYKVTNIRAN